MDNFFSAANSAVYTAVYYMMQYQATKAPDTTPPTPPDSTDRPPAMVVITCAVLEDEIAHYAQGLDHILLIRIIEQGLHNDPHLLRKRLQEVVDQVEAQTCAQAIVLGYGLCSRGIEGVVTQRCKLVMARAHDCITLLLGDKERYASYVKEHPGTYWYSRGWLRYATMPGQERYEKLYQQYRDQYGQDNAEYLMETEQHWFRTYDRAAFVELSIGRTDEDGAGHTQKSADWLGWKYDHQQGDPDLIRCLLLGHWDEARFVVLEPGQTVRLTADERIIEPVDASIGETSTGIAG